MALNYRRYLTDLVVSASGPPGGQRLLDFGVGVGTHARALRDLGYNVTCIEPDHGLQEALKSSGFRAFRTVESLAGEHFDVVYSFNVLEHIEDDIAALRQLRGVTAPDGTLVLYVPAFQFLYTAMDRKVGHLRRYRRAHLDRALELAGYQVDRSRYADSLGVLATLAYQVGGSRRGDINESAVAAYDRYVFPLSRALDSALGRLLGKNLAVVAHPARVSQ